MVGDILAHEGVYNSGYYPDGTVNFDHIFANITDDIKGRFSGSYGIKKGHTDTVFSLCAGTVTAYRDNEAIFSAETSDGFGIMENNTVRLTVDSIKENSEANS